MSELLHQYLVPYSESDASVRERVHAWAQRIPVDYQILVRPAGRTKLAAASTTIVFRNISNIGQGWPEKRLLSAAAFGIYELDDGLPVDDGRIPELGRWWKPLVAKSRIAHRAARTADRVVVGNETLAEWATTVSRDVRIVPTCVEPADYATKADYELTESPRLVWMGSRATEVHLWSIAPALVALNHLKGVRLCVIGDPNSQVPNELAGFTSKIPWTPEAARNICSFGDIGIMPLPSRPYEQMKCAYKLLQYGAASLPIIGSPVGASSAILKRCNAPTPNSIDEWVDAVCLLLDSSSSTRRLSSGLAHCNVLRWRLMLRRANR
jgi:glycosyltransferase involved in cell wall biosynthesis